MRTFQDLEGRAWSIKLTLASVRDLKTQTGIYAPDLVNPNGEAAKQLIEDPFRFFDILLCVLDEQMSERGVTEEELGNSLDADTISEAERAFWEALSDFLPARMRPAIQKLIRARERIASELMDTTATEAESILDNLQLSGSA